MNLSSLSFLKTLLAIVGPLNFLKRSRMGLSISTEKPVEVLIEITFNLWGFPGSSAGKESACNAGDSGLIPGSERTSGERIGYPFQYSWASLLAQMVKNLPSVEETWVQSLGWEAPLEEGLATHSSILAWRIPRTEEPGGLQSMGSKSWTRPSD